MTALFSNLVPIHSGTLRVATLNTFCAPSKPRRVERAQEIASKVLPRWQREGIEIIGMQEVFTAPEDVFFEKCLFPFHWLEESIMHRWQFVHSGLAIASTYPIKDRQFSSFSLRRFWARFSNTGVQMATVAHPLGNLAVVNTHLQPSFSPTDPTQNEDVRLRQIKDNLEPLLQKTSGLTVVMGDLNHDRVHQTKNLKDPKRGKLTPEYDYLVRSLRLADPIQAIAAYRGMSAEALFTFGPGILCAESDYAAAGFKLLFDRIHIGTTNPRHLVVIRLDDSHVEIEDTGFSDHCGLKLKLGIDIYDRGLVEAGDSSEQVIFVGGSNPANIVGALRMVA